MAVNSGRPPGMNARRDLEPFEVSLSRLRDTHIDSPEILVKRAADWLESAFGTSESVVESAFSHGCVGLLAQHTCYFNGFAVLLKMAHSMAVAIRPAPVEHVRISIVASKISRDKDEELLWRRLAKAVAARYIGAQRGLEIAIASNMPPGCFEGNIAALVTALSLALIQLPEVDPPEDAVVADLMSISATIEAEYSRAYLLAARHTSKGGVLVIDTETREVISLEGPLREQVTWGIVDAGMGAPQSFSFYKQRGARALEAHALLQKGGSFDAATFRELANEDLKRVLNAVPRRLRKAVRHLITENKRVYGIIKAIRRKDWQKMGGILLMSHASLQGDWGGTNARVDFIVGAVQDRNAEGMYGASITGRSGCVLVAGQPIVYTRFLYALEASFQKHFGYVPENHVI